MLTTTPYDESKYSTPFIQSDSFISKKTILIVPFAKSLTFDFAIISEKIFCATHLGTKKRGFLSTSFVHSVTKVL